MSNSVSKCHQAVKQEAEPAPASINDEQQLSQSKAGQLPLAVAQEPADSYFKLLVERPRALCAEMFDNNRQLQQRIDVLVRNTAKMRQELEETKRLVETLMAAANGNADVAETAD